ncbi:MAG TPA: hypothetical protein VIV40_04480 [Kofleriaceae bacterium]
MKGLALLAVLLCGCDLYFGGSGDDVPPCATTGGGQKNDGIRDPYTGNCQWNTGCYDNSCGCGYGEGGALPPEQDWGACYSTCSNLDEQTCFVTSGCYAAYIDNPAVDGHQFWGCWATAPSGPVQGQCSNLDAYSCSRHDDCIAVFASDAQASNTKFEACAPEPSTYCLDDTTCGANAFCDHSVCYPDPGCTNCPNCGVCADVCYGVCIPKDPMACDVIDCGPGYHCAEQCYPGDPNMQSCYPVCVQDITCANVDCGAGYTCEQTCTTDTNGQVTCYPTCTPIPPVATCESLTSESDCIGRPDCMPVYDGYDCTCFPDHCECQVLTYDRCEPL